MLFSIRTTEKSASLCHAHEKFISHKAFFSQILIQSELKALEIFWLNQNIFTQPLKGLCLWLHYNVMLVKVQFLFLSIIPGHILPEV